ncbi:zinc finger protein ubi-d4-like isoform X1 [Haliotis rubra]|uniref:zinc finger protein ubi-d4-like isoform X1 n=1 Tax=Haliotis rubra TaxID=36100 RepID=UPI001EE61519|nr:zinc finger protein ubi-d4-like isoform X1 [Haliotis rubra]
MAAVDVSVYKKSMGSTQLYKEALEQTASFNTRMAMELKMRLPFLDSQTGLAQNHSNLWHPYMNRQPGNIYGQIYSYPAKRWKKKKRSFFAAEVRLARAGDIEMGEAAVNQNKSTIQVIKKDMHQISAVENPAHRGKEDEDVLEQKAESQDRWFEDFDMLSDPPDAGEMVDDQSDISDYEDTIKKKKKKGPGRGRRKNVDKDLMPEEKDKPYVCEACGARYKTRPGLAYHYTHFHNGMIDEDSNTQSPKPQTRSNGSKCKNADGKATANNYCDFCLGDAADNRKTKLPEELVSCSDCGRSGHPTCLQFTANMIISVKKYPWQCIECKSCGLCGTSDNDDQLLFCDDCDRGYHMYCLTPPLTEPPEGNWSCHLCIEEFHGGKKPAGMQ